MIAAQVEHRVTPKTIKRYSRRRNKKKIKWEFRPTVMTSYLRSCRRRRTPQSDKG